MSVIASVTSTLNLLKTAIDARDQAKVQSVYKELNKEIVEIQNMFFSIQEKNFQLLENKSELEKENRSLKNEIEKLENKISEQESYKLFDVFNGNYVLRFVGEGEEHFICQPCFDNRGHKCVLQSQGTEYYFCPECKTYTQRKNIKCVEVTYPSDRGTRW